MITGQYTISKAMMMRKNGVIIDFNIKFSSLPIPSLWLFFSVHLTFKQIREKKKQILWFETTDHHFERLNIRLNSFYGLFNWNLLKHIEWIKKIIKIIRHSRKQKTINSKLKSRQRKRNLFNFNVNWNVTAFTAQNTAAECWEWTEIYRFVFVVVFSPCSQLFLASSLMRSSHLHYFTFSLFCANKQIVSFQAQFWYMIIIFIIGSLLILYKMLSVTRG